MSLSRTNRKNQHNKTSSTRVSARTQKSLSAARVNQNAPALKKFSAAGANQNAPPQQRVSLPRKAKEPHGTGKDNASAYTATGATIEPHRLPAHDDHIPDETIADETTWFIQWCIDGDNRHDKDTPPSTGSAFTTAPTSDNMAHLLRHMPKDSMPPVFPEHRWKWAI